MLGVMTDPNNGALQKLLDLIATLRGPDGCPWDREQTAGNILSDLIEETYELQWAYANDGKQATLDELGDVVFVLTFAISLLREEDPSLDMETITQHAYDKIYGRHPHVFGDEKAATKAEGLAHWEAMKAKERAKKGEQKGLFAEVPGGLPPLRRAEKIQRLAASTGFDWQEVRGVLDKIKEEVEEVESAGDDHAKVEEEVGDLLFSIVNLTRFLNIDPEKALANTNAKFIKRYNAMRALVDADGEDFPSMTLEQMDVYWERAKRS